MKVVTKPHLDGVESIFRDDDRLTNENFKKLVTLVNKAGYRLAGVKAKRVVMPKVPLHRPVVMRIPVEVFGSDDPEVQEYDMVFKIQEVRNGEPEAGRGTEGSEGGV